MNNKFIELIDFYNFLPAAIASVIWGVLSIVHPNPLYFNPLDYNVNFEKKKEIISTTIIIVIVIVATAVCGVSFYFLSKKFPKTFRSFKLATLFWFVLAVECYCNICVAILKNYVGRARPSLIASCGPDVNYTSYESCPSLTKSEYYDLFRSWPSGHSASGMSGLLLIALFIQGVFIKKGLWVNALSSLFVLLALFIGSTRIVDFKHHTDDVAMGLFLGALFALLVWDTGKNEIFLDNKELRVDDPEI